MKSGIILSDFVMVDEGVLDTLYKSQAKSKLNTKYFLVFES